MATSVGASSSKMRWAFRKLCEQGVDALRPTKVSERAWRGPLVSKRVANDLRKQALRSGTYGSFDTTTGVGWDPAWDSVKKHSMHLRKPKGHRYQRNREERAQKIEQKLTEMDGKIDEHYAAIEEKKPVKDFDWRMKYIARKNS